jgi:hypothetical protein
MFVTVPEFEFHVPAPLKPRRDARYWHAISIQTFGAWYVATIADPDTQMLSTLVFSWDDELARAIEQDQRSSIVGVVCMLMLGETHRWTAVPIRQIWRAVDPQRGGSPCVLLVDEHGTERSGYFAEEVHGLRRMHLVAQMSDVPADKAERTA